MQQESWDGLDRWGSGSLPCHARKCLGQEGTPKWHQLLPYPCCTAVIPLLLTHRFLCCRPMRDALHSAARRLELLLLRELAAANLRRLLDFCRRLQAAVGTDALHSPLAALLLGAHQQRQHQLAALGQQQLDYNEAVVLAASCMLAADTCCGSSTRGASLQVSGAGCAFLVG